MVVAFRTSEEFYDDRHQFSKDAFCKDFKLGRDEYRLLVMIEYPKLDFSYLDEEFKKRVAPSEQENDVLVSVPEVTFNEMDTAPTKVTPSIAIPKRRSGIKISIHFPFFFLLCSYKRTFL